MISNHPPPPTYTLQTQESEDEGPPPVPTVPKDPSQTHCAVSREPFEEQFDEASQAWVYKVRGTNLWAMQSTVTSP